MNRSQLNDQLGIQLPPAFDSYSDQDKRDVVEYIRQLTPIEKQAYTIARGSLMTSFNILKSNGFHEWKTARENAPS